MVWKSAMFLLYGADPQKLNLKLDTTPIFLTIGKGATFLHFWNLSISKIFFPTLSLLHPTEVIFRWFFGLFQYSTQNRPFLRRINFQLVKFTLSILYGANHLCRVSSRQKRLFFGLEKKFAHVFGKFAHWDFVRFFTPCHTLEKMLFFARIRWFFHLCRVTHRQNRPFFRGV